MLLRLPPWYDTVCRAFNLALNVSCFALHVGCRYVTHLLTGNNQLFVLKSQLDNVSATMRSCVTVLSPKSPIMSRVRHFMSVRPICQICRWHTIFTVIHAHIINSFVAHRTVINVMFSNRSVIGWLALQSWRLIGAKFLCGLVHLIR